MNYQKFKIELITAYKKYKGDDFLVGRLHNKLLQEILTRIRKQKNKKDFVLFISCLNFFYSTRIQLAEDGLNFNVVKIAEILRRNWDIGLNLSSVKQNDRILPSVVQKLREKIHISTGIDLISLASKIVHQLNSQYPIYDGRVCDFLKHKIKIGRINIKDDYCRFCDYYLNVMNKIDWPVKKVDEYDNAIWVLMDNKKYH